MAVILLAPVVVVVCAGCGNTNQTGTGSAAAIGVNGKPVGNLSTPGVPKGQQTVKIEVVAKTGAKRAALALVPVYIDQRGPYLFAVDTGASTSLISSGLAHQLHLPQTGGAEVISGVGGSGRAVTVRIGNWSAGKVPLPPSTVAAMLPAPKHAGQPAPGKQAHAHGGHLAGPIGLLGSDVLSRYGKIAVDYNKSLLILDPPVQ